MKIKHFEIWKPLKYKNKKTIYEISNKGKIRNKYNNNILKTFVSNSGYERVCLFINGKKQNVSMHREVAITFKNNYDNKEYVNHKNGNKLDNREFNLEWVSASENTKHVVDTLLFNIIGENNPANIYNEKLIINICKLLEKEYKPKNIKKKLNLSTNDKKIGYLIADIRKRKTWRNISKNYIW